MTEMMNAKDFFGPLAALIGEWKGDKGMDIAPEPDGEVFHHQTGYWYFERKTGEILYSLIIPRAVAVLARGKASGTEDKITLSVSADAADKNYGIIESTFMANKASTRSFVMDVTVEDNTMTYKMNTGVHIYGKNFAHTDENTLVRSL